MNSYWYPWSGFVLTLLLCLILSYKYKTEEGLSLKATFLIYVPTLALIIRCVMWIEQIRLSELR